MKLKKSVRRTITIIVIVVVLAVLGLIAFFGYKRFKPNETKKTEVVDSIKEYNYVLEDDSTDLYKKLYENLRDLLNKENYEEEEYAKLVAQLLVVDFYTLENKLSKNDIGGVQFIREEQQDNFVLEASETVYKYVEHNIYGDRTQQLPEVTEVEVKSTEEAKYKYKDISDEKAYKVVVTLQYEKDLGYPEEVTVVMIHGSKDEKKLEVIKMY